jgi:probable blue pigment (indigoidine) exporter
VSDRVRGPSQDLLLLILLGALWGSAFPVIRAGIVAGAPPLVFAAVRYAVAAAIFVPLAVLSRTPLPARSTMLPVALYGGGLIVGLYGSLLYLGEQSTSGGLAAVLAASAALWSAVIGYPLLPRERFRRGEVFGLLVGFAGVAALVLPDLGSGAGPTLAGPFLVLGAVVAFAAGGVLLRRGSGAAPSFWTLAVQLSVAAVGAGAIAVGLREPPTLGQYSVTLPALAYLVVSPSVLGYALYFGLHHRIGPGRANVVVYVAPVAAVLIGLLAFGERVSAIEIGGMAVIAAGLFIVERTRPVPSAPGGPPPRPER